MTTPRLQQDPAEGSREIVDRELARQSRADTDKTQAATRQDAIRLLGDRDDIKLTEVLALRPTVAELEQAVIWSRGEGDLLGKSGRQLTGKPARIFEILSSDEDEEESGVRP